MTDSLDQPVARLHSPSGEVFLYPGQSIRLGRSTENDVVLDDPKISRVHAEIVWNGSGFLVSDLGSVNGTFINSTRLSSSASQLHDGDEISLSRYVLVYELIRDDRSTPLLPFRSAAAPLEPDLGPRLVVTAGPDQGQVFPLWGEVITIGRSSSEATWEIRLSDRSVSRPHARLERTVDGYILTDLESANGTSLNGTVLESALPMKNGDIIGVGNTSLELVLG